MLMAKKKAKKNGLKKWFGQNKGKGWIDCKTGKACKRPYPACRPTKAQCTKKGTSAKKGPGRVSWKSKKSK